MMRKSTRKKRWSALRWLAIGAIAAVAAAVTAAWHAQQLAEVPPQQAAMTGRAVSYEKAPAKAKPSRTVRERPGRDRGPRPGESR